jgi:hypothetical protein
LENKLSWRLGAREKGDRFELSAYCPSFDNPENILKFKANALFLHNQIRAGEALHARRVFSFWRDV